MYIITDGTNYVMENPMKVGEYVSTTSPVLATEFTYKKAKQLLQRKGKKTSWIKKFQMLDVDTGEECKTSNSPSNAGAYIGENDIKFDESILDKIKTEANAMLSLEGWDEKQLATHHNVLNSVLSKYDSAISDISHALTEYSKRNNGKKPPANKMAKIGYLSDEIQMKRRAVKESMRFIDVMRSAIIYKYDVSKLKYELSNAKEAEYKGRTEFYKTALDILG